MRIICYLFFTILFDVYESATGIDLEGNEAIIDTRVVQYDENDEIDEGQTSAKKERIRGIKNFVGTNLFGSVGCRKKCFSSEDVALLAARRDFESLIPKDLPDCLLDDELAKLLMQYFYGANQVIEKMTRGHSRIVAQQAFSDTLGGYLRYYMIPISKHSFYAGLVKLKTVQSILQLYTWSKNFLNTNGNGWRGPITDLSDLNLQIEPLRIVVDNVDDETSCTQLDLLDEHTGEDDDMIVTLPRLDPEEKGLLVNIWLPFKRKRTFNLQSSMSAFVLLRYFELTTRCYRFQNIRQTVFNRKLKDWIMENLEIHLRDDVLYPGLGAVLRITETLRSKNKGTVFIEPKLNEKRQRTQDHIQIQSKPKDIEKLEDLQKSVFDTKDAKVLDDILDTTIIQREKDIRTKFIYIAIGVSISLVLIVFLVIGFAVCKKRPWRRSELVEETPKVRKSGWFCCKKHRKDDQEVLLNTKSDPKYKSKKHSKRSSKMLKAQPETTSTCCGLYSNNTGPAVIETSSMDSDSGKDSKVPQKSSTKKPLIIKTTTIDEKKRFSISKKSKQKDSLPPPRPSILKKGV